MNNDEIIRDTALKQGLYSKDDIAMYIERGEELPLHTRDVWISLGYMPQKGIKGIETKLWKKRSKDDAYYLSKAYLYTEDQVVAIDSKEVSIC